MTLYNRVGVHLFTVNLIFFLLVLLIINIISSDIQINPGPVAGACKRLSICHVNIRSLSRSKLGALQVSLAKLHDIITLSETHLHAGVTNDLFQLQGFHDIIRKDRNGNGGGVALFIKENLTFKRLCKYETPDLEAIWVQLHTLEGKILLCCCYRPPDQNNFWDKITKVIDDIKSDQYKYIFLLGDINADFHTLNGRKLTQMCLEQNLQCLIHEPTRITETTATVLDQIITNAPNFVNKTEVTPPISSNDHCTIAVSLNFKIKKEPVYSRLIWQYEKTDFKQFRTAIEAEDFENCFVSGTWMMHVTYGQINF